MSLKIVTANLLAGGNVVFLAGEGRWSSDVGEARVAEDKEQAAALEALARDSVARNVVVDPYLIDVERAEGGLRATKYRELLRTAGPSVRPDLGYQADASRDASAA